MTVDDGGCYTSMSDWFVGIRVSFLFAVGECVPFLFAVGIRVL